MSEKNESQVRLSALKEIKDHPAEASFTLHLGQREVVLTVVNFDRETEDEEVRAEMERRSFRPITRDELWLFKREVLGAERSGFPILAYGNTVYRTPIEKGGFACTPVLSDAGEVELFENWCLQGASGWHKEFAFLFAHRLP